MKKKIGIMIRKITKAKCVAFVLGLGGLFQQSQAQICGATNSNNCTLMWFSGVSFKNSAGSTASYQGLNCTNTGSSNKLMTSGAVMDLTPGEEISMTIENTCSYALIAGVWIDLDGDGSYTAAECISKQAGPLGSIAVNTTKTATLTIPCTGVKPGKAMMRVRAFYSSMSPTQGCGTVATYGNIMDFEINLKAVNPPSADFAVPTGPNFIKTPILFNSTTGNAAYKQTWSFQTATNLVTSGAKGKASWANTGYYNVKLKQEFCGLSDSIIKSVKIEKPTAAPTAEFIASDNQVEVFYTGQLFDLSTNGAYKWNWTATSPSGAIVYTSTQQNPIFSFDEEGWWEICLTSENDIGPSTKLCKSRYIEVVPPGEFYMGPSKIASNQGGILYDNGGKTGNYGNNRKTSIDYFEIFPCGAKEIRLNFKQLKLSLGDGGDRLRIYDGQDASGKEITPAGGITGVNYSMFKASTFKAFSGAMYITFESNSANNDSGFIATWDSELLPVANPKSGYTVDYTQIGNGTMIDFVGDVKDAQGQVDYDWMIDGNSGYGGKAKVFTTAFYTDGTYEVCLIASICNGTDTFCRNITVTTPTVAGYLDYAASNLRPKVGETIQMTAKTDYASNFEWSIFPATYSFVGGTNLNSRNPLVVFNAGGAYTFTLRAWNSAGTRAATEKKVIKTKYVIAVKYCTPVTDMLSSDVAISKVELFQDSVSLLENPSTVGDVSFTDFTDQFNTPLSYGSYYTVIATRRTNSNSANFKAWIDYNIDGNFTDDELILNSGSISTTKASNKFRVPDLKDCFEGFTKMRVAVSYGAFSNTSCGVNVVGEFEDYGITLANDKKAPVITLLGSGVVRVEKNSNATACWSESAYTTYTAKDPTEGDLTTKVVVTTDLDCTTPGTYYVNFNVLDAAGNAATTVTRNVIVVLDKTAPTLTLLGGATVNVEQCEMYNELGAVASDLTDGNLSSSIKISGSVNTSVVGKYTLTYNVADAQGNAASVSRVVNVVDTKKPGIFSYGKRIVDQEVVNIQIGSLFVDAVTGFDTCNGSIAVNKVPGFNGMVNTLVRATYPILYFAKDPNGNAAVEEGFVVNYRVDDYIAPEIALNTPDTVVHDVNSPYSSQPVSVYDNYYTSNKVSIEKKGKVNPFTLGLYTETFTATDESGNTAIRNRYVKVVDRVAPTIITSSVNVCAGDPFWAMSDVSVQDNYYGNNDLFPLVKILSHNVNVMRAGMYYINYQVTDPSGNKSQVVLRPVMVRYAPDCENSFVGTENLGLADQVQVYPNPSSGVVTVDFALNNMEAITIEVTNLVGAKVATYTFNGGFGSQVLDLGKFGQGTYLLNIRNQKETTTKKIVIAN
jgi:PKD repeat protein